MKPLGAMHLKNLNIALSDKLEQQYMSIIFIWRARSLCYRQDLVRMLQSCVPASKNHYGKRFRSRTQDEDKLKLRCSDNEAYVGSILVGADAA
ncbi:hypothetical protein MVEG_09136 [Podila verticillata NRRL 6337]|nr:hypothetical protein MVEG_09136 [Podila verticillata NRRL 6337]